MSATFPIPDGTRELAYAAAAGQTQFAVTFPFQRAADLTVRLDARTLVAGTDYIVSGTGAAGGGAVTLATPAAVGARVDIVGLAGGGRTTSLTAGGRYDPAALDKDLDRLTIRAQEARRDIDHAIEGVRTTSDRIDAIDSTNAIKASLAAIAAANTATTAATQIEQWVENLRVYAPENLVTLDKLVAALSTRLRVDADQALTAAQQERAARNISAIRSFAAGTALPTADVGPIWHADFAAIMTWRTIGTFSGYASVNLGEVSAFAATVPPPGWLRCNGAALSAADAALIALLGKNAAPDLRAEFIRGLDDGRGVDTGRVLGSAQADDLRWHTHPYTRQSSMGIGMATQAGNGQPASASTYTDQTGGTGGTETRPRNVALLYCIKR